ncbi:BA75_05163T0 [Komagataella pastoris]|uniref:BA75_05163T0 n=1 Tax=Komagataella pastoris TaxID=4922 RepID=A0A1B2JII8_PICPA|nr:BA75_05163T0 [Komagataella pastoris]
MSKISKFLDLIKRQALNEVVLVCGNQSADLDSIASSISYAYLHYQKYRFTKGLVIPLLNIPEKDLALRKDAEFVLTQNGIKGSQLWFTDDLSKFDQFKLIMVDHNIPQGEVAKCNPTHVVGIIDHHQDEQKYLNSDPRVIEECGSCSSLVFNYWYDLIGDDVKECATLLASAIMIDTNNFTQRVKSHDEKALKIIKTLGLYNVSAFTTNFERIQESKLDLEGLSMNDILRKDYKQFVFNGNTVGVSSIVKPFSWLDKHFDIEKETSSFGEEHKLDLLVLMTAYTTNDQFNREISFHDVFKDLSERCIKGVKDKLNLNRISGNRFTQNNLSASRKQVVPYLEQTLTDTD